MTIKKIAKAITMLLYPNIKVAVRSLSLITSTAPIVLLINYFRENIWVRSSFTFFTYLLDELTEYTKLHI